jgi:hypothetical protein
VDIRLAREYDDAPYQRSIRPLSALVSIVVCTPAVRGSEPDDLDVAGEEKQKETRNVT